MSKSIRVKDKDKDPEYDRKRLVVGLSDLFSLCACVNQHPPIAMSKSLRVKDKDKEAND